METLSRSACRLFKLTLLAPAIWMIGCLAQSHPSIATARQERQAPCAQSDDEKRLLVVEYHTADEFLPEKECIHVS
jgi:Na+-transporting methylmalonyl-CoA/oxaloacetate decarboxylase gamma subunit